MYCGCRFVCSFPETRAKYEGQRVTLAWIVQNLSITFIDPTQSSGNSKAQAGQFEHAKYGQISPENI